ncbi:ornithine carbamoyltransferase [Paenibacillus sp. YIM B09110]|uniref:ornithine carbamoyltransferase n=1 Tax=Paenibacillus sp. YIM B09110 TaxID=3126102 RepID=UPI00301DFDF3
MNFLDIDNLTSNQIIEIFHLADQLRMGEHKDILKGKTFILFFPENSIRTRVTFEKGIKDLGGQSILFTPEALDRREQLGDMIQYIENWADGVIVRHPNFTKIVELSERSAIPIINAMTDYNHPCEILSDLYSIGKVRENYRELVYTFVGPAGNISRSWMKAAAVMDLAFNHVCIRGNELSEPSPTYTFHTDLEQILSRSDVVLTDSLPNGLLKQSYIDQYQITVERMDTAREGALLCPCPPFYRNEEVSESVIASPYFVGYKFKGNLIYIQQAIILFCLRLNSTE